jgi:predicted ATPase
LEKAFTGLEISADDGRISLNEVLDRLRRSRMALGSEMVSAVEEAARNVLPKGRGITFTGLPGRSLDPAVAFTRDFFASQVKYLGPLREEPKAIYPIQSTSDPQDVGLHGEHTAAVLHRNRFLEIQYIPTSNFGDKPGDAQAVTKALEEAVFDWLEYLDVAKRINTSDEGKFGYSLKVIMGEGSVSHDLTHVGVGVSQVLPIVVMCLLAAPDTTIILEQPELHLNPKVQTRLADFFLSMAMLRKQCLIETHSEYLINRLRLRSALAEGTSVSELLKLYFVEKTGGFTTYRDVRINEYGTIRDWPKGFFDQNQREIEAIILAASEKS